MRSFDGLAEFLIKSVNALISLKIHNRELFDDLIFLVHRHLLKLVHFFLNVPEPAVDRGQLREHLADRSTEFRDRISVLLVNLVRGESELFDWNLTGERGRHEFIDLGLKLLLLRFETAGALGIVGVPEFELDRRQLVRECSESFCHV